MALPRLGVACARVRDRVGEGVGTAGPEDSSAVRSAKLVAADRRADSLVRATNNAVACSLGLQFRWGKGVCVCRSGNVGSKPSTN